MARRITLMVTSAAFAAGLLSLPELSLAANLYFTPAKSSLQPGETITLELRVDNQNECVNAAEVNISYPKDLIEAVDVSRGDSIFTVWIMSPAIRREFGLISLIGGIPGGYCGRVPGDPAVTNVIAKPIFRAKQGLENTPIDIKISVLKNSKVVLNDGFGTEAVLTTQGAEIKIAETDSPQRNSWTDILQRDKIAPETFTIEVHRDPAVFEGKYFAVWNTVDKQSGLDRFEIKEGADLSWRRVESPYVLGDQNLRSLIRIRAIDKAGNERVVEYLPSSPGTEPKKFLFWFVGIATIFLAVAFRFFRFIPWPW